MNRLVWVVTTIHIDGSRATETTPYKSKAIVWKKENDHKGLKSIVTLKSIATTAE